MRVATFNTDQFRAVDHQWADLSGILEHADVALTQETLKLDLVSRVKDLPWRAFQHRAGSNDGHANTAVLTREGLPITRNGQDFLVDSADTRRRFITWEDIRRLTTASAHLPPGRDEADMRTALANLRKFARAHRRGGVIIALDKNECPIGELEKATGLTWHGIGRDGFLSNLRLSDPRRLPIRYSDHHPVVVTII